MHFPGSIAQKLDEPYPLTAEQVEFFQQNRFIKLKQVFDEETIRFFNHQISAKVDEMRGEVTEMDSRDTYGKAFVQLFNLWLEDHLIKRTISIEGINQIVSVSPNIRKYKSSERQRFSVPDDIHPVPCKPLTISRRR